MRVARLPLSRKGFTLLELLVAVTIVAILTALVMSGVQAALDQGKVGACAGNLKSIGVAIAAWTVDHDGKMPYGPEAGAYTNAGSFYPSTGSPTSLISLQDGSPVALGLLIKDYLSQKPEVLFCPGNDQQMNARTELAKVGKEQAQSGYYYRHGGNTNMFDRYPAEPPMRPGDLGLNRRGRPIRAVVMDINFTCPPDLKSFNINPVSNHRGLSSNILYADGRIAHFGNDQKKFTVDVKKLGQIQQSFSMILDAFENADEL